MIEDKKFRSYIRKLHTYHIKAQKTNIGAIVMNCNPFTLGHRYLIEVSSKKVDLLYVFVVEENKSYFPFEDRINLVKEGTRDIKNVVVLPSGRYMISAQTLPTYFMKEEHKNIVMDASRDLDMFVYIANELNIKVRFVGEEPVDQVTRQYNESMKQYLNKYRIDVEEIARLKSDKQIISASIVRSLIKQSKWIEIKKYVPNSTYQYIKENYMRRK